MSTLRVKSDQTLGRVAKLLRGKGWRTPVRVPFPSRDLQEGEMFLCVAHKDSVEAIPIGAGNPLPSTERLSGKEKAALKRVGLQAAGSREIEESIRESAKAYVSLLSDCFTVEETARRLAVNESRVRQRLNSDPPSLYGIKHPEGWRLPRFQFDEKGEIPGFGETVGALDPELDPVSVARWFTSPSQDLTLDNGIRCSPRDWLRGRHPTPSVVALARSL